MPLIAGPYLSPARQMTALILYPSALIWPWRLSASSQLLPSYVSPAPAWNLGDPPKTCCPQAASLCTCLQVSVLTGIIKISLKTLLECVRLRTFGRFGLQQVQVDCHFLQLYLWRFVADEELVHLLLDEVVASAALRCPDPVPMEPSVVEVICERG